MVGKNHSVHLGAAVLLAVCAAVLAASIHGCSNTSTSMNGSIPETTLYQLYTGQPACLAFECHQSSPLAIYPPGSGEHKSHRGGGDFGLDLKCMDCHYKYDDNMYHYIHDGTMYHKNGFINGYDWFLKKKTPGLIVYLNPASSIITPGATFDHTASQCSGTGTNCHGAGASDNWYNGSGGSCGNSSSCHLGTPLSEYPPMSGAHAIHRYQNRIKNVGCATCHFNYYSNPTHHNGSVNGSNLDPKATVSSTIVYFNPGTIASPPSWDNATANCGNSSCHTAKNWYNYPSMSQCPVCHPYPPLSQYPPTSGLHGLHLGQGYACSVCHYNYPNSYVKNVSTHNNQVINGYNHFTRQIVPGSIVIFDPARAGSTYTHLNGDCNPSCHGNENWYTGGGG